MTIKIRFFNTQYSQKKNDAFHLCAGPFGIEDVVGAGGPLVALCGFGLIGVWAIPEALVTAGARLILRTTTCS